MNTIVTSLRVSPARGDAFGPTSATPHPEQKRARSGLSVPQVGHGIMRGRVSDGEGRVTARVASPGACSHHRCPVSDTIPVTRGLVTRSSRQRHYGRRPISGEQRDKERVMNTKHRPGEYADSSGDDTEGQSFQRRATEDADDTEGQSFQRRATEDGDDTEGQSFQRRATEDTDDTEGQSFQRR